MQAQRLASCIYIVVVCCMELVRGSSQISPFIIGGSNVDIAKHPYLVSIRLRLTPAGPYWHMCAGVIITENAVLTAAQCLREIPTDRIMIVAHANLRLGGDGKQYPASRWVAHPDFSTRTADYDIGLVFVDLPFELTAKHSILRSISIRETRPPDGRLATVAGWGYREEYGPSSHSLEETKVSIVSMAKCFSIYGVEEVTERMICAGNLANGSHDACQGDTGGPLIYDGELVGLVSWGRGCARPGYPSVYTYVASLKSWIEQQLEGAAVCEKCTWAKRRLPAV